MMAREKATAEKPDGFEQATSVYLAVFVIGARKQCLSTFRSYVAW